MIMSAAEEAALPTRNLCAQRGMPPQQYEEEEANARNVHMHSEAEPPAYSACGQRRNAFYCARI